MDEHRRCHAAYVTVTVALGVLTGCERAPTFSIVGSFFPAWLFCIFAGILLAWGAHWVFVRVEVDKYVNPGIVVYPCIAGFFACTLWLLIFA